MEGLSNNELLLDPLLQVYVLAPLAVKVAVKPIQILEELTLTVGRGVTETVDIVVFVQPFVVPVTVKLVLDAGETFNGLDVEPVFHEYVEAPLAVKVAVPPAQIVGELTITVGRGVTDTFDTAVLVQPFVAPVTVKFVLEDGDTVNELPVDPTFHEYVEAPLATNVVVWPEQMVTELTVTDGNGITVTIPLFTEPQPPKVYVTV